VLDTCTTDESGRLKRCGVTGVSNGSVRARIGEYRIIGRRTLDESRQTQSAEDIQHMGAGSELASEKGAGARPPAEAVQFTAASHRAGGGALAVAAESAPTSTH